MSEHNLKSRFLASVIAAALAGIALTGSIGAAALQQEKAHAEINRKIHQLSGMKLKKIIAKALGDTSRDAAENVDLKYVSRADVVVDGIRYALIFMGADDVGSWKFYKSFLPAKITKEPASVPSDDQVLKDLRQWTSEAQQNFNKQETEAYERNKKKFRARYPSNWSEQSVVDAVRGSYEVDGNGDIAPDAQKAYNEYMAFRQLTDAMELYIAIKKDL
jgi:uncharacterized protein YgiM (DUF1202 family)